MSAELPMSARQVIAAAWCLATVTSTDAAVLLMDDFSGATLSSAWTVEQGFAVVSGGHVDVHGSTAGTRDGWIAASVGSTGDWSDYHFATRFVADGGGAGWYRGELAFRVQDWHGWTDGTFYRLMIDTPIWSGGPGALGGGTVLLARIRNGSFTLIAETSPSPGTIHDRDNAVDVWALGDRLQVSVNGTQMIDIRDTQDPIRTGGVALGAIWESHVRYDHAFVATVPVPEPGQWVLMLTGAAVVGRQVRRGRRPAMSVRQADGAGARMRQGDAR